MFYNDNIPNLQVSKYSDYIRQTISEPTVCFILFLTLSMIIFFFKQVYPVSGLVIFVSSSQIFIMANICQVINLSY